MLAQPWRNLHPERIGRRAFSPARLAGIGLMVAALMAAGIACAEQPIDAVQRTVADGLQLLRDPFYEPAQRKALQRLRLRELLYRDFDFMEFSRRVLADKWRLFSGPQRADFVEVFARFLADYYLARLQQHYSDERVEFRGQEIIAPGRAVVRSTTIWMNRGFSVEVRLHNRGGSWKVYDVSVLGISAVQIYRAQFQEIMRTRTPQQVIEMIRNRIEAG